MADFCKQCSEEIFDKDYGDFKGIITEKQSKEGYAMPVLCEGCGPTYVDHEGKCIGIYCIKHQPKV